ncbi:MAG: hypothetical protein K2W85_15545 [Phycisphaerales bacterium]|nr:hypothetical protein [Phycisphaerales bacterium]
MRLARRRLLAPLCVLALAGTTCGQTWYLPVPSLLDGTANRTNAAAISRDGSTVVGASDSLNSFGGALEDGYFLTVTASGTIATGPTSVGTISPSNFKSDCRGVSGDGSIIAGSSREVIPATPTAQNRDRAFRFTSGSITSLGVAGQPAGTFGISFGYAVSADGNWIVGLTGTSAGGTGKAFRWSQAGGFQVLPALPGTSASSARAVSGDGSVVVGDSADIAFRWTQAAGTVAIPAIPGAADSFGLSLGVNFDGSVVVGAISSPSFVDNSLGFPIGQAEAFRFSGGTTRRLGGLPSTGSQTSSANAISDNGLVIVGESRTSGDFITGTLEAFVWTPRWGMITLASRVVDSGGSPLIPAGTRLTSANGISGDGTRVVGEATDGVNTFGYVVQIRPYCVGDHNDDGLITTADIFAFLNDWFASVPTSDADASGVLSAADIFAFLNAWFSGC